MVITRRYSCHRFSFYNLTIICLVLVCICAKVVVTADASSSETQSVSESSEESDSSRQSASQSNSNNDAKSDSVSTSSKASNGASGSNSKVTITASNTIASDKGTKPAITPVVITATNTLNGGSANGLPGLGSLTAMPTLSSTGVPAPTVTIPSNSNNPFMKQSTLPEGTVFIAVGCILLGILLAVVGWNLALFVIAKNSKDIHYTPAGGFGSKDGHIKPMSPDTNNSEKMDSSNLNGGTLTNAPKGELSEKAKSMYKSGLFFSPTAEVMSSAQTQSLTASSFYGNSNSLTSTFNSGNVGAGVGSSRLSTYMPSGYYGPTTPVGVIGNASPSIHSATPSVQNQANRNTMLSVQESARAPSAYLDDFLRQ